MQPTDINENRDGTPERILREFQMEAENCYKIGIPSTVVKAVDLGAAMLEFKDEWDLKAQDLYNTDVKVQYMCYLDNLGATVGALLGHKYALNLDIDLRERRNTSGRQQITVTTMH